MSILSFFTRAVIVVAVSHQLLTVASAAVAGEIVTLDVCPPTPANPRHDHQLIFPLNDGRLLLIWSEYYTTNSAGTSGLARQFDSMPCRIAAKTSADAGRTWSQPYVFQENTGKLNVKHPNLFRLPSGEILFFYTEWNSPSNRVVRLRRSKDDCRTWSEPNLVSAPDGITNINNDHVLRHSSGRIILPAFHSAFVGQGDHWRAFCHYSDDDGSTWHKSTVPMELPLRGAEEPSIIELKNGDLLAALRTSLGQVYQATSADRGVTWSKPVPNGLKAPASPPALKRIPASGELLLIWNHNYDAAHHHQGERRPLSSAISRDEGKSWSNVKVIEPAPEGAAAYAAASFVGPNTLVTYYYQEKGFGGTSGIRLKIIPTKWFVD